MNTFLEYLAVAPKYQRKILILTLTVQQLKLLTEIIFNSAMDTMSTSEEDKNILRKYKLSIRKVLVDGITKQERRRRLLTISNILPRFINNYLKWQKY